MTKIIQIAISAIILCFSLQSPVWAQSAGLMPMAQQQFFDNNGNPLSSGTVTTYIVGTTTLKTTWQDAGETIPNTNPIVLNAAGRAIIYGDGNYRQVVRDRNGNIIWDAVTSAVGTGGSATLFGDGTAVGTVLQWSGLVAPQRYVFAYGQELSRVTYSALYSAITLTSTVNCTSSSNILTGLSDTQQIPIGAPVEATCVAGGTTVTSKTGSTVTVSNNANITTSVSAIFYPWGNGNGTSTFNVPDLRGRALVGRDNLGGTAASRLTLTYYGANPDGVGAAGGSQSQTLVLANLPAYTPTGTIVSTQVAHNHFTANADVGNSTTVTLNNSNFLESANVNASTSTNYVLTGSGTSATIGLTSNATPAITSTLTGTAQGGTSTPFSVVPPSITFNYIIKITPDTSISTLNVVTSLGGMTGDITCSGVITCSGQNITASGIGTGDVVGPGSATSGNVASYDGTTGKILKDGVAVAVGSSLYPNITASISTTATSTIAVNNIVVTSASGLAVGMGIYATFASCVQSSSAAFRHPYITTIVGTTVTMSCPATATNASPVAIQFGKDRYDATSSVRANSGGFSNLVVGAASQGNTAAWMDQISTGQDFPGVVTLQVITPVGGGYGGVFAGRTSDATGGNSTFPIQCYFLADTYPNNPLNTAGQCAYTQSNLLSTAAGVVGHVQHEYSLNSVWPVVDIDPFAVNSINQTRNIRFDCGTGQSANNPNSCSAVGDIVYNGANYRAGLVVQSGAMDTAASRIAPFLSLPRDVSIEWFSAAATSLAKVYGRLSGGFPVLQMAVPSNGSLDFSVNGTSVLEANVGVLFPVANNAFDLGTTSLRWSNVFSVLGNFSGALTSDTISVTSQTGTGALVFGTTPTFTTEISVNGATSTARDMLFRTATSPRVSLGVTATAESGGNAGTDFTIATFSDAGSFIAIPFFLKRSTGFVGLGLGATAGYQLDVGGDVNTTTVFRQSGVSGVAGPVTCTTVTSITVRGGIITAISGAGC